MFGSVCYFLTAVTFNPDSQFTMKVLFQLEKIGIAILRELTSKTYKQLLQSVIGISEHLNDPLSLLDLWLEGHASLRPTWRNLFYALREIQLNHLAEQIEAYLSEGVVEQTTTSNLDPSPRTEEPEGRVEGEEEGEADYTVGTYYFSLGNNHKTF